MESTALHVNARLDTQVRIVRSPARANAEEIIPLAAQKTYRIKLHMDVTLSVNVITYPRDRIILVLDSVHTKRRSNKSTLVIVTIIMIAKIPLVIQMGFVAIQLSSMTSPDVILSPLEFVWVVNAQSPLHHRYQT